MKRIAVVITARPSYSRIKTVLEALHSEAFEGMAEVRIIAAGAALVRNYGRVVDQIREDGFHVSAHLPSVVEGNDDTRESAIGTGLLLTQIAGALQAFAPDVVVTVADRHETLATAIAASYQNIPLCHIQGGEVSGSIDDKVRNAITQLADIHCVATERAEANVKRMRLGAEVHVTGCPSIDLAAEAKTLGALPGPEVVVLQHPVTDEHDRAAGQMSTTIKALDGMDAMYFWPGEDAGGGAMSKELRLAKLRPVRNLDPLTFLRTLLGSGCLVGNSSVGIRECSYLGIPAVNIGDRQLHRERGANVVDTPHQMELITDAVNTVKGKSCPPTDLYGDGAAGERIAEVLCG